MRNSLVRLAAAAAFIFALSSEAHADYRRVCRGTNLPAYKREIRNAVRDKLTALSIPFKSVQVNYRNLSRTQDTFSPNLADAIGVGAGSNPAVSWVGPFPSLDSCAVTGKIRIRVQYENGSSMTLSDFSAPGTMLFRASMNSEGGLGSDGDAD